MIRTSPQIRPAHGPHTRPVIALFSAILAAAASLILAAPEARAAEPVPIGTFSDWRAFKVAGSGGDLCYALAQPQDAEPKNVRRGPIYFMVTNWPARNVRGEVSVVAGYPYKDGSTVTANVDGTKFQLFTQNDSQNEGGAWVADRAQESKLVDAMKRGNTMIITGTSTRGTLTTDRYSLSGITAAMDAITGACK